jgi:hypothetical protein
LHKKRHVARTIAERFALDASDRVERVEETPDGLVVRPAKGFAVLVKQVWAREDAAAYVVVKADVTPAPAPLGVGRAGEELFAIDEPDAFRAFDRAARLAPVDLARLLVRFQHDGEPQELIDKLEAIGRMLVRREVRRVPGFSLPIVGGGDAFAMDFCTFRVPWPQENTGTLYRWHVERPVGSTLSWSRRVLATGLTSPMFARR